tara:strand:- start:445 stop:624 length:180 start_codon:yes stop_codon:yes gene_type:complete
MLREKDMMLHSFKQVFKSDNVPNSNGEPSNMVDAIDNLARAMWSIANTLKEANNPKGDK